MKYEAPEFKKKSFNCPHCSAFSHMEWSQLLEEEDNEGGFPVTDCSLARCVSCNSYSLWLYVLVILGSTIPMKKGIMLFPETSMAPLPTSDMPDDVRADYEEAATIAAKSPRAAAALLRLGLQKLCVHLGKDGKNIDADIRALAKDGTLPSGVIKAADTMRITGNNCVHPGQMKDADRDDVALQMFGLLNFIVEKAITEPKELEALYKKTPENPRKDAEARDAKAKNTPGSGS